MISYRETEIQIMGMMISKQAIEGLPSFRLLSDEEKEKGFSKIQAMGLVDQEGQLTEVGKQQMLALKVYCEAKVHLNIGGLRVGKYNHKENVLITKIDEAYSIYLVSDDQLVVMLLSRLPEVNQIKEEKFKRQRIKRTQFNELHEQLEGKAAIYFERKEGHETTKLGIIYVEEGYLNIYDQKEEVLKKYPSYMVQGAIEELVQMG